jgi:hypothetical protein
MRAGLLIAAAVVLGAPSDLAGQTSQVTQVHPVTPFRVGASWIDVAFDVVGSSSQISVSAKISSNEGGALGALDGVLVDKDAGGVNPFHLLVPLNRPLTEDAVIELQAKTADSSDSGLTVTFDARTASPAFARTAPVVRTTPDAKQLVVEVDVNQHVVSAEANIVAISAQALNRVNGSLADAEPAAFAVVRGLQARPSGLSRRVAFVIPVLSERIPADGVVIADLTGRDAFGRTVHTSVVEFTSGTAFDPVVGLRAGPSPMLLSKGYGERQDLRVTAQFTLAGDVDVSGQRQGVTYTSSNESVAVVSPSGEVTGRNNGTATITVTYGGASTDVEILVDSTARLESIEIVPPSAIVPRIGGQFPLRLEGVLDDGRRVDLTSSSVGTRWSSDDAAIVEVSQDGVARGRQVGRRRVSASHGAFTTGTEVEVLDARPEVNLVAPPTVLAGTSFVVRATASDDVGVQYVEFLLNDVPAERVSAPPYQVTLQAPPYPGSVIKLAARAVDSEGKASELSALTIRIDAPPETPAAGVVVEAPLPGAMLVAGLPNTVRVTSGKWQTGTLSAGDFELVRVFMDRNLIGTARAARIEPRKLDGKPPQLIEVPLWEVNYIPGTEVAGTSMVLEVEGVTRSGAIKRSAPFVVLVKKDGPPLVTIRSPLGPTVTASAGIPLGISGLVGDDAMVLGVNIDLLVGGAVVARTVASGAGFAESLTSEAPYALSWTPPTSAIGRQLRVDVRATDVSGLSSQVGFDLTIRADQPPQVQIISPTIGASYVGGTPATLLASVIDDGVEPVVVDWLVDGRLVASRSAPPYAAEVPIASVAESRTLNIAAVARDSAGLEASSSIEVFVIPDGTEPTLAILTPADGGKHAQGQDLLVNVGGSDNVGVTLVEILLDGQIFATDTSPLSVPGLVGGFASHVVIPRDRLAALGPHRLEARAYDASGNVGFAPGVSVTVEEDAAPTVAFVRPSENAVVTRGVATSVLIQANDDVAVTGVTLTVGGQTTTRLAPPYLFSFVPAGSGATELVATATDGVQTATARLTVNVSDDTEPPFVAFKSPQAGARVVAGRSITVEVVALDNVAVSSVELFADNASLGVRTQASSSGAYSLFSWPLAIPESSKNQTILLRARARDSAGLETTREQALRVTADEPPVVSIVYPSQGSRYQEGEELRIGATVGDDEGVNGLIAYAGPAPPAPVFPTTAPIDSSQVQILKIRAPIVSKGQPPVIGVMARDTAGHTTSAELSLTVEKDEEAPRAVMTAPLPGAAALKIRLDGSLAMRIEVEDDVGVAKVVPLINGLEAPVLSEKTGRIVETTVPSRQVPGTTLVDRRYVGAFEGVLALKGLPLGRHRIATRTSDWAGNATDTAPFDVEIFTEPDTSPPALSISAKGTPNPVECVAESELELNLSAQDETALASVVLGFERQEDFALGFVPGGKSFRWKGRFKLPALGSEGERRVTFSAAAEDTLGHRALASFGCVLVADRPPEVAIAEPAHGVTWVRGRAEPVRIDASDDLGVQQAWLAAATDAPTLVGKDSWTFPGPTQAAFEKLELAFGEQQVFAVSASASGLIVAPQSGWSLGSARGRLTLMALPVERSVEVLAKISYRYRIVAGMEGSPVVAEFLDKNPGGIRNVVLAAPDFQADLSFPAAAVAVERVDVELTRRKEGTVAQGIDLVGLDLRGTALNRAWASTGGKNVLMQRDSFSSTQPGQSSSLSTLMRIPLAWKGATTNLTAAVIDGKGAISTATRVVSINEDLIGPRVTLRGPEGGQVLARTPFPVTVDVNDANAVRTIELLADGVRVGFVEGWDIRTFTFDVALPLTVQATAITAIAADELGNVTVSQPLLVSARADAPPKIAWLSLESAFERATGAELNSGIVSVLQGTRFGLTFATSDDVGLRRVEARYRGEMILSEVMTSPTRARTFSVSITPPLGVEGAPHVIEVDVEDVAGAHTRASLVTLGRRPQAPAVALVEPPHGAVLPEGSVGVRALAIAGDDTGIASVAFLINGQPAQTLSGSDGGTIPQSVIFDDETGIPRAADPRIAAAAAQLPKPFEGDVRLLRRFDSALVLFPGLAARDPGGLPRTLRLTVIATDAEGTSSSAEAVVSIGADDKDPVVEIFQPTPGRSYVEGTTVEVKAEAADNAFVEEIEILAGPTPDQLATVHRAGGFPVVSSQPGDAFAYHSPLVKHLAPLPALSELGMPEGASYLIVVRARDGAGRFGEGSRLVDIKPDRGPTVSIVNPVVGRTLVAGSQTLVVLEASDDVAVTSVRLFVDGQPFGEVLRLPPFTFSVPIHPFATSITIGAEARDSFGNFVTDERTFAVGADQPPTVAIAKPRDEQIIIQGRPLAIEVGASDDVEVRSISVGVTGGLSGPVQLLATTAPAEFAIPVPFGSAGRTLVINAQARDSFGHVVDAESVSVVVAADTTPPSVSFKSPLDGAQVVAGQRLDLEAIALDDVEVARVEFAVNGQRLAILPTPPFAFAYRVPQESPAGSILTLSAQAVDSSGNVNSAQVLIGVEEDRPPSISLFGPSEATVGRTLRLEASAQDDVGVSQVDLFRQAEPGPRELGRRFLRPYVFQFRPLASDVGPPITFLGSATDITGKVAWSAPLNVTVNPDKPPVVAIVRPYAGETVFEGRTLEIMADASDAEAPVARVVFLADGRRTGEAFAPAGFPGRPTYFTGRYVVPIGVGNRSIVLTAVAVDDAGQETISPPILVGTVKDTVPPEVQMVEPPNADVVTAGQPVTVSAAARDNAQVKDVSVLVAGQVIGTTATPRTGQANRPLYDVPWLPPVARVGDVIKLGAEATDPAGNVGRAEDTTVEVGMAPLRVVPFQYLKDMSSLNVSRDGMALAAGVFQGAIESPPGVSLLRVDEDSTNNLGMALYPDTGRVVSAAFFDGHVALVVRPFVSQSKGYVPALLTVLDVRQVPMIVKRGSIDLLGSEVGGVAFRGRVAFVANENAGVAVIDISDTDRPRRIQNIATVGAARDVAVAGRHLLVGAGTALRVFDLEDPRLPERGFVALPGRANQVQVNGDKAVVACGDPSASLATVSLVDPARPRLLALHSHKPARRDLFAPELETVSAAGNLAVGAATLFDQDGGKVKRMLTVSRVSGDGTVSPLVRANLPSSNSRLSVGQAAGQVLASYDNSLATFALPRLAVVGSTPSEGEQQVATAASIVVEFSAPPDPNTSASSFTLRANDPVLGIPAAFSLQVAGRQARLTTSRPLAPATTHHLTVDAGVRTATGLALGSPHLVSFRTRSASGELPEVHAVAPGSGPVDGGTKVTITGRRFAAGARVLFSGRAGTEVVVAADGLSLTTKTPAHLEGPALVTVVNPDGLRGELFGGFLFLPVLDLAFVSPATGRLAGGTIASLSGKGFQLGASVSFDGALATNVRLLSSGEIQVRTPPGEFGPADVAVMNPDGKRVFRSAAFFYSDLEPTAVVARHNPDLDGPTRPVDRLPQGQAIAVQMAGDDAWLLSDAFVNNTATDPISLLTTSRRGALTRVDLSDSAQPLVGDGVSFVPPLEPAAFVVRNGLAYVISNAKSFGAFDIAGEGVASLSVVRLGVSPAILQTIPVALKATGIAIADDIVLIAAEAEGVIQVSIANPERPILIGNVSASSDAGYVDRVTVAGRHLVTQGEFGVRVRDLGAPGMPVVGRGAQNDSWGETTFRFASGLAAHPSGRGVSISPPTLPRVVSTLAVPQPRLFDNVAIGSQFGALVGQGFAQIISASDPSRPLAVDLIDLRPGDTTDVAVAGDLAVVSIRTFGPSDTLVVLKAPFPVVVATQPEAGARLVPAHVVPTVTFNRPVVSGPASEARLRRLDGSVNGTEVAVQFAQAGNAVTLTPAQPLQLGARYQLRIAGFHDEAGAVMPGPFTADFDVATSPTASVPTFSALVPREGSTFGGTQVTLSGTGLETGADVRLGGIPVIGLTVAADGTTATFKTPAQAAGAATLTVENPSGGLVQRHGAFLFVDPLSISAVTPNRGPIAGGMRVTITGKGFATHGAVAVEFGGLAASDIRVLGVSRLEVTTPKHVQGAVQVKVVNPDGATAVLPKGFTYELPAVASVGGLARVRDILSVGHLAFTAGSEGLGVYDLSGLYGVGPRIGLPISQDAQSKLVDEDGDGADDRRLSQLDAGDLFALSYPASTGTRLYAAGVKRSEDGVINRGFAVEIDIADPTYPRVVKSASFQGDGGYGIDVRDRRASVAAGTAGLRTFDVEHQLFPMREFAVPPSAQTLAVAGGLTAIGTGARNEREEVVQGKLEIWNNAGDATRIGGLPLDVQRMQWWGNQIIVAAGARGLVVVDASDPAHPIEREILPLGGFAWDLEIAGDLAYVATGDSGIAVVRLERAGPPVLVSRAGGGAGASYAVGLAGARLIGARQSAPSRPWNLDFGVPEQFVVTSASVVEGAVVGTETRTFLVNLSGPILPDSAPPAFSLTADGSPLNGTLEAGSPQNPSSTLIFQTATPLPTSAQMVLAVSTALTAKDGRTLVSPFVLKFATAPLAGAAPAIAQVVPSLGSVAGGMPIEILGSEFGLAPTVQVGGLAATVLAASNSRITVATPPGAPGLADVTVTADSGLSATRHGAFFYSLPVQVDDVSPRFLNPKGSSVVTVGGQGFLPAWSGPLGASRVLFRGVPALSVSVESPGRLVAIAPPGSFGPADVIVISPDGVERSISPVAPSYGLAVVGDVRPNTISPVALAQAKTDPLLLYAAPGSPVDGNSFLQPYLGPYTGGGTVQASYRVASFDVGKAGEPALSKAQIVDSPDHLVDRLYAILKGALPADTPLPDVEIMPDALDVAVAGDRLYVANGEGGLAILDARKPEALPLLARVRPETSVESMSVVRILPIAHGAWTLGHAMGEIPPPPNVLKCIDPGADWPAMTTEGSISFVDAREVDDPLVVRRIPSSEGAAYGAAIANGWLFAAEGQREGVKYCPGGTNPPPEYSVRGSGARTTFFDKKEKPRGALTILPIGPGLTGTGRLDYAYNLTDVVVIGDVAIASAAEFGLLVFDVANPTAPKEIHRVAFNESLANVTARPERLRLVGGLLMVAGNEGGVVLVDVSNPRLPRVVSAGNTERAVDVALAGGRLFTAGVGRITELAVPFSLVTAVDPSPGSLVPPSLEAFSIDVSRPIAETSVRSDTVILSKEGGGTVPLTFVVTNDHAAQRFTIKASPASLEANQVYTLEVTTGIRDQKGGGLLLPSRTTFSTGAAGSRQPLIVAVSPTFVSAEGRETVTITGVGLAGLKSVLIGGKPAPIQQQTDSSVRVTVPASVEGSADVFVEDNGGPSDSLTDGLLYLQPIRRQNATMTPDHGPVAGGTQVTVTIPGAMAPGTRVRLNGELIAKSDTDVLDLSHVTFITPLVQGASFVPVELVRPGQAPVFIGLFSYDQPLTISINLPGFPPREVSELRAVGRSLFVGVATPGHEGLEIFDTLVPEYPIRTGGLRTGAPVRGLDVAGSLALLANDALGITVVDVERPEFAYEVAHATTAGLATGVRIEDVTAFVSVANPGPSPGSVQVFDLGASPGLSLTKTVALDRDPLAIDLGPDRFYLLTTALSEGVAYGLELGIYDRSGQRLSSTLIDQKVAPYRERVRSRLAVRSGRAYVTVGSQLLVFDIDNESSPKLTYASDLGAAASGITWGRGDVLVGTSGEGTVQTVPPAELLPVSFAPGRDALAVPGSAIHVEFNLPVQPESVDATTFEVLAEVGGTTTTVPGQRLVEFAVVGSVASFTPNTALTPGSLVHVKVAGVRAFDTRPLSAPLTWSFTVSPEGALQPAIAAITPNSGAAASSTGALISGSGFREGTRVFVGGSEAMVLATTGDSLQVVIPPAANGKPGPASVEVVDPAGLRTVRVGGFVYRDKLQLTRLTPDRSGQQGGTSVRLDGHGFVPGMTVDFGGTRAFTVAVASSRLAYATAPPHAAGLVTVVLGVPGDSAELPNSFLYGSGAVARLDSPPVSDVVLEGVTAYAALGATTDITDRSGKILRADARTPNGGLLIASLAESGPPRTVKVLPFGGAGGASRVAKLGNLVFVAAGDGGVQIVDVERPAEAKVIGEFSSFGRAVDIAVVPGMLFVGDGAGISGYRLGETALPLKTLSHAIEGGVSALRLHGDRLLVSSAKSGDAKLFVFDARAPQLKQLGVIPLLRPARHITAEGNRAFVSLGAIPQVAIVKLSADGVPSSDGSLLVTDPLGSSWVSAESARVVAGLAYVAAGGGKLQRFTVPVGAAPAFAERAQVFGDARGFAFGTQAVVGTLFLDKSGEPLELPVMSATDADLPLAGGLATVAFDHIELLATSPTEGEVAPVSAVPSALFTQLVDEETASHVKMERLDGVAIPVFRTVVAEPGGTARVSLRPLENLEVGETYVLRIGADVADLAGGRLGANADVRFTTATRAALETPVISTVSPRFGLEAGGETIQISGSGILPGATVSIGATPATVTNVAPDGTAVTVIAPPGQAGTAAVTVTNPGGLATTRFGAYRYLVLPVLTRLEPDEVVTDSQSRVKVIGQGIFPGTQVLFAGLPGRNPLVEPNGTLTIEAPPGVVGTVDVTIVTPGPQGSPSFTRPSAFTFTLPEIGGPKGRGEVLASFPGGVLSAWGGNLTSFRVSPAGSLIEDASVAGVPSPTGLVVSQRNVYLTGGGQLARYNLGNCGLVPGDPCAPVETARVEIAPGGVSTGALAANAGTAFVALAWMSSELVVASEVNGELAIVARRDLGPGGIKAMAMRGQVLAALVEEWFGSRLLLLDASDPSLSELGRIEGLPINARTLRFDGTNLAISGGYEVRLYDTNDLGSLALLGRWESSYPVGRIALAGPWVVALTGGNHAWLLDATDGLAARGRASVWGANDDVVLRDGVLIASSIYSVRSFGVPYPTTASMDPAPGGLFGSAGLQVTLPLSLPLAVTTASTLALDRQGVTVAGTLARTPGLLSFVPAEAPEPDASYQGVLTLGPTSYVGGNVRAPFRFPVRGLSPGDEIVVGGMTPSYGEVSGGIEAVVSGMGFAETAEVRIGGKPATVLERSSTAIRVIVPASPAAGPAAVEVSNGTGRPGVKPAGFVYIEPFTVVSVAPSAVDLAGGWVTIRATGLHRGVQAFAGGSPARLRNLTVDTVEVEIPAGAAGPVPLSLLIPGVLPIELPSSVRRTDLKPPSVVRIQPLDVIHWSRIPLDVSFTITFDEPLTADTTGARLVKLPEGSEIPVTRTLDAAATTLSLAPIATLSSITRYKIVIEGLSDPSGNKMPRFESEFRTIDTKAPAVSIVRPGFGPLTPGAQLPAGYTWAFDVQASDDSGHVASVAFEVDGLPVPRQPDGLYRFQWSTAATGETATLVARARDAEGNEGTTSVVVQITQDAAPVVDITKPLVDLTLEEGQTFEVEVAATDDHAVASLEVRFDNQIVAQQTGTSPALSLTKTLVAPVSTGGPRTILLEAKAEDDAGLVSAPVTRQINVVPDATPPVVAWIAPASVLRLRGGEPVTLSVVASDANGIKTLEFHALRGGEDILVRTFTGAPFETSWTTPRVAADTAVVFKAIATDARGNKAEATTTILLEPGPNRPPSITSVPPTTATITVATASDFTRIELTPADVGSTSSNVFSTLPTTTPTLFGLNGPDVRRVNFDTTPSGVSIPSGTTLSNEYESLGVTFENVRVANDVYGGAASPPNATTSPFNPGEEQIFRFHVPVVAVGVINTSPDQNRFEFFSPTGELIFSTRDQDDKPYPNYDVDRFVGARTNNDKLIGSMRLVNTTGQMELDELIFEVSIDTLARTTITYPVTAVDPDGDVLRYFLVQGPQGASIDPNTGVLTWTATNLQAGPHDFTIAVEDLLGGFDQQSFTLTVNAGQPLQADAGVDAGVVDGGVSSDVDASADQRAGCEVSSCGPGRIQSPTTCECVYLGINVLSVSYGQNCGAPRGYAPGFESLSSACNGEFSRCDYFIDAAVIGDPAYLCSKAYEAEYFCGVAPEVRRVFVPAEASQSWIQLSCP